MVLAGVVLVEFCGILNDPSKEVSDFHDVIEEIILVERKSAKKYTPSGSSSNT